MTDHTIFVYDQSEKGLEYATWLLGFHRVGSAGSGLILEEHSERNGLLQAIAERHDPTLALIDLQADDRFDQDYSGHRIIETIRRHPDLSLRCRPLAFTIHARKSVIELARRFGAYGLVSKEALEVPSEQIVEIGLAASLHEMLALPTMRAAEEAPFAVIPSRFDVSDKNRDIEAEIASKFRYVPDARYKRYFWDIIRYLADDVDRGSIARWVSEDYGIPRKTVAHDIEDLGRFAAPRYRSLGLRLEELARDLLTECPEKRPAPTETLTMRMLHRLVEVRHLAGYPEVVRASWADEAALEAVRRVSGIIGSREQLGPRAGQWAHTAELQAVLEDVEPDSTARARLQASLIRGVNALYDASLTVQSTHGH